MSKFEVEFEGVVAGMTDAKEPGETCLQLQIDIPAEVRNAMGREDRAAPMKFYLPTRMLSDLTINIKKTVLNLRVRGAYYIYDYQNKTTGKLNNIDKHVYIVDKVSVVAQAAVAKA